LLAPVLPVWTEDFCTEKGGLGVAVASPSTDKAADFFLGDNT